MDTNVYIRCKIAGFILWPASTYSHPDAVQIPVEAMAGFVTRFSKNDEVVSAGFVRTAGRMIECFGNHKRLGLRSLVEDTELLAKQLRMAPWVHQGS